MKDFDYKTTISGKYILHGYVALLSRTPVRMREIHNTKVWINTLETETTDLRYLETTVQKIHLRTDIKKRKRIQMKEEVK